MLEEAGVSKKEDDAREDRSRWKEDNAGEESNQLERGSS